MWVREESVNRKQSCWYFILIIAYFFAALMITLTTEITAAQETPAPEYSKDLEGLLDAAKDKGLNVIVIAPPDPNAANRDGEPKFGANAVKVRWELRRIFSKAPELGASIVATWEKVSPDGTYNWLWIAIATAVGGLIAGTIPVTLVRKWNQAYFAGMFNPEPQSRAEKITYLMFRAFLIALNITLGFSIAVAVAFIFDSEHDASRATIGVIIVSYFLYRIFRHVIFFNIIAPDVGSHRVINLSDEEADKMQRVWRNIMMFVIIIAAFFVWMALIGLPPDPLKLLVICSLFLCALIVGYGVVKHRREFTGIIIGSGEPYEKPFWRRLLAEQWHILMLLYLAVAWVVSSARIVLNLPSALQILSAPLVAGIAGIAIYGLVLILIDRFYASRLRRFEGRVARARELENEEVEEIADAGEAQTLTEEQEEEKAERELIEQFSQSSGLAQMPVFKPIFKELFEEAAGVLILIAAIGFILGAWEVDIGERGNPVTAFIDTLILLFLGWVMYRAVAVYIGHLLEEEGDNALPEEGVPGDEMSGKGASRLSTLLPLVRNIIVAAIVVLTGMVILSNMGVDIAPLFAGAGVIGLAIGFGAQTLIRDIFSGGFYLFDDAFRKGEYIELGNIRGTVEKISLRSFQLRHHNGPLHTIPFGDITQLTNYSRDWVMMKLPIRLTYDTDVERVRKLVKKLGQQLLEHPEVGDLFLQPLKSQGVYQMEDSAMIIRLKFMTKPGDQFVTRKVVYASVRDLFEREGIRFANKEVTVRLADEPNRELTEEEKSTIAAAAARAAQDEEGAAPKKVDDGP